MESARALLWKINPATHRVIVINSRPNFVHWFAMVRACVSSDGELEKHAIMPYKQQWFGGKGEIRVGRVTSIIVNRDEKGEEEGGYVVLESGEKVEYSALVLATGFAFGGPFAFGDDVGEIREHLKSWRAKFEKANDIVLLGGGAIGVGALLLGIVLDVVTNLGRSYLRRNGWRNQRVFPSKSSSDATRRLSVN